MTRELDVIDRINSLKSKSEWFNSLDVKTFTDDELVGVSVRYGVEEVVFESSLLFESDAFAINGIAAGLQAGRIKI